MLSTPLHYASALILIGVLVLIHEFGHFLVARLLGVQVRVFSVGFGPRLVGVVRGGTDYRISGIPFGGYVRMAGADPFGDGGVDDEEPADPAGSFMNRPPWQRLAISLAGPVFNLILPFLVFTALFTWGEPQSESLVGAVRRDSLAEKVGFQAEDRLVSINGEPVRTWDDVDDVLLDHPGADLRFGVERAGATLELTVPGREDSTPLGFANAPSTRITVDDPASPVGKAGIPNNAVLASIGGQPLRSWNDVRRLAMAASGPLKVSWFEGNPQLREDGQIIPPDGVEVQESVLQADPAWGGGATVADDDLWKRWGLVTATLSADLVSPGSASEAAGVQVGDRFLAIDGQPVMAWEDVLRLVAASSTGDGAEQVARPVKLMMRRQGQVLELEVTPKVVEDTDRMGRYKWRPMIGVGGGGEPVAPPQVKHAYPLPQAAVRAATETTAIAGMMVEQLGKLFTGEAAIQKSLGGPIEIVRQAVAAAERGLFEWARHMAVFSISLGILNLLPVPVLDGGQVMMYFLEWVRGRPLPLRLRELALQGGVIFLVLLTLMVMVMDVHRWVFG